MALSGGTYLFWSNWLLGCLAKLFDGALVEAEILLAADEDNGKAGAEVQDLGDPLFSTKELARRVPEFRQISSR